MDAASATLLTVENLLGDAATAVSRGAVREAFHDELAQTLQTAGSFDELLQMLAQSVKLQASLGAVLYYEAGAEEQPAEGFNRLDEGTEPPPATLSALSGLCVEACRQGAAQTRSATDGFPVPAVVVPIATRSERVAALCALLEPRTSETPTRIAEMLRLAAAQITIWQARTAAERAELEARSSAALLELTNQLESSDDLRGGCSALADGLQSFLGCQRVALGVSRGSSRHCRLQALSGFARFNKQADVATAVEAALDETMLLNEITRWPPAGHDRRTPARTHEQLVAAIGADLVLSVPLHDAQGKTSGVCLLVDPPLEELAAVTSFMRAAQESLGTSVRWLHRSRGGPLTRVWLKMLRASRWRLAAVALGVVGLLASLGLPLPHRIGCDCQLQPIVRRFVAAPYDGTLEETLVQPGDVVAAGEVLARMDGQDTRLELLSLEAEHARARKVWEASLSLDDIHEAQQAKLEMKRLELKIQLLQRQQQNLQIQSPLRGVVVSGDLEKSEGAPLTVGQSLFEIAPLSRMKVEVVIPEDEIAYVQSGVQTRIRLDAYPRRPFDAVITQIVPRAEARDDKFVFLAEAELDNDDEMLRPGMNGRATLIGPRRRLGWLLFHKPYESLLMLLGW